MGSVRFSPFRVLSVFVCGLVVYWALVATHMHHHRRSSIRDTFNSFDRWSSFCSKINTVQCASRSIRTQIIMAHIVCTIFKANKCQKRKLYALLWAHSHLNKVFTVSPWSSIYMEFNFNFDSNWKNPKGTNSTIIGIYIVLLEDPMFFTDLSLLIVEWIRRKGKICKMFIR